MDADLPVDVTRLSDLVRDQLEPQRLAALLFSLFGLAAIVLGGIGVWGLVTEETTARRRELGIMAAIGATPVQLALSVARATGRLVALGFLLGTAGGVVVARLLSHLLSGLPPVPWAAVISTVAVIVLAAWLPAHVPVWRITRGQPAGLIREH